MTDRDEELGVPKAHMLNLLRLTAVGMAGFALGALTIIVVPDLADEYGDPGEDSTSFTDGLSGVCDASDWESHAADSAEFELEEVRSISEDLPEGTSTCQVRFNVLIDGAPAGSAIVDVFAFDYVGYDLPAQMPWGTSYSAGCERSLEATPALLPLILEPRPPWLPGEDDCVFSSDPRAGGAFATLWDGDRTDEPGGHSGFAQVSLIDLDPKAGEGAAARAEAFARFFTEVLMKVVRVEFP
ncbi:hypothetical protein LO763_17895 [Glycomyces sp. A-F 0318]|uniref:hypothetical protein n=1 Tax=Glycomyces amatae TaxID=2881355 RepID=UPI001E3205F2|nr:hypothetical protein [Glycomyces amatae]MCD0445488.1 hypothetical protein [Glycomyces amatae]